MKKYNLVKRFSFLFATLMSLGSSVNGMTEDAVKYYLEVISKNPYDLSMCYPSDSQFVYNVKLLKDSGLLKEKKNVCVVPMDRNRSYGVVVNFLGTMEITNKKNEKNTSYILEYVSKTSSGNLGWTMGLFTTGEEADDIDTRKLICDVRTINSELNIPLANEDIQKAVRSYFMCE